MFEILWSAESFGHELKQELVAKKIKIHFENQRFFIVEQTDLNLVWCQSRARNAQQIKFQSIREAQDILKSRGKLWTAAPLQNFRRSELILEGLKSIQIKPRKPFTKIPSGPLGVFCLEQETQMWVSNDLQPSVPIDSWQFTESKEAPSRAYLKLWELFSRAEELGLRLPQKNQACLELGSAPGGWTWVLANLGSQVTAVDRGQMAAPVLAMPGVKWLRKDAFAQDLYSLVGPQDWFFSDLICYPADLYKLVSLWHSKKWAKNFVCTIKFQGKTDSDSLGQFLKIPSSQALHLFNNKHEVTWFCQADS